MDPRLHQDAPLHHLRAGHSLLHPLSSSFLLKQLSPIQHKLSVLKEKIVKNEKKDLNTK